MLALAQRRSTETWARGASIAEPSHFSDGEASTPRRLVVINRHDCDTTPLLSSNAAVTIVPPEEQIDAKVVFSDQKLAPAEFAAIRPGQVVNRIPHVSQMLLKGPLAKILENCDVGVSTWRFPEHVALLRRLASEGTREESFFIIKPNLLSGGRGIVIRQGVRGVLNYLESQGETDEFVVQPYLDRPLLSEGRKCDMRVYVLVTGTGLEGDAFRAFVFKKGVVRVASRPYESISRDNMNASTMHLANDLINVDRPLSELVRRFEDVIPACLMELFLGKLHTLVETVIGALQNAVREQQPRAPLHRQARCYQLLGFDVFVDDDCQTVRLLEVNGKPCMACDLQRSEMVRQVNTEVFSIALQLGMETGNDEALNVLAKRHAGTLFQV